MKVISFLILAVALKICISEKKSNDLNQSNLKGPVSCVINLEYTATEKFGELVPDSLVKDLRTIYFNSSNYIETYTPDGNIKKRIALYGIEPAIIKSHNYDEHNIISFVDIFDENSTLLYKLKYDYSKPKEIRMVQYDRNGQESIVSRNILNENGKEIYSIVQNDTMVATSYPMEGVTISKQISTGEIDSIIDKRVVYSKKRLNNQPLTDHYCEEIKYEYNENGDMIAEHHSSPFKFFPGYSKLFDYKYDSHSNWIEKREVVKIELVPNDSHFLPKIIKREIFYREQQPTGLGAFDFMKNSSLISQARDHIMAGNYRKYCNAEYIVNAIKHQYEVKGDKIIFYDSTFDVVDTGDHSYLVSVVGQGKVTKLQMSLVFKVTFNEDYPRGFLTLVKVE